MPTRLLRLAVFVLLFFVAQFGLASDQFQGFLRYPVETQVFTSLDAGSPYPIAYYRDVFVGGETYSSGAADGDYIYAEIWSVTDSGSSLLSTWFRYTFHSTYAVNGNTYQNCWVGGWGDYLCGSNAIDVLWYRQQQCMDGVYTMKFYRNSVKFAESTFKVKPRISPDALTKYDQTAYRGLGNEYDSECRFVNSSGAVINPREHHQCGTPLASNEIPFYISAKGCFLTDTANLLSYHGVEVDPPTLNTYLKSPMVNGYDGPNVQPTGVISYAQDHNSQLTFQGRDMSPHVCDYGPQVMGVKCRVARDRRGNPIMRNGQLVYFPGHWVTVIGQDDNKTTWLIDDPADGKETDLATKYNGQYCAVRNFRGPGYTAQTMQGLTITFHSPVELLLSDSSGRKVGIDPIADQYFEDIPNAYYDPMGYDDAETGEPEDEPTKEIFAPGVAAGEYTLTVTGTDDGTYSADFNFFDVNGKLSTRNLQNISIAADQVQKFTFTFDSTAGASSTIAGGFDGGGQRPRDVNKFLTYSNPSDNTVSLPTGTQNFPLFIFYGATTIPSTFTATLDGTNVSQLFHTQPGGSEVVNLPLHSGRNVLVVSIDGNLPTRTATDTDRFVFTVQ